MMETPLYDFAKAYAESDAVRLHMPGHKGKSFLGCEMYDITEIDGVPSLFEGRGIIRRSEENARDLFGTRDTLYSAEGSSLCIRAMLYLAAMQARKKGVRPIILCARNAHKVYMETAALLDISTVWLTDESESRTLCRTTVTPEGLRRAMAKCEESCAVYITSPDYLGNTADIAALAEVAHGYGVPLIVDNAHGAYLRFLSPDLHPISLGADMCCDSAHKTLTALTGAAYLHISGSAPELFYKNARRAMELFASTSPSFLILESLDLVNRYLAQGYAAKLAAFSAKLTKLRGELRSFGWNVQETDALRLTVETRSFGYDGGEIAKKLCSCGSVCEYSDPDYVVMMLTPENTDSDLRRIAKAFGDIARRAEKIRPQFDFSLPPAKVSAREAVLSPSEIIPVGDSVGRILAAPTVSCPPAICVAASGEEITESAVEIFKYYSISHVQVML